MGAITIVILISFAIVLSNILSNIFPRLPLTLIQIAFGCFLGFSVPSIELEPQLFMLLIIVPLLYREAEESELSSFWKLKQPVILMAFLLVFVTVVAIGFSSAYLLPMVPVAACFALGAILSPTDVVAVSSLSNRVEIDKNLMTVLLGEGLINDASGLIAFRFAVAALLTGGFSILQATGELFIVTLGSIAIGLIILTLKRSIVKSLRFLQVDSIATYVLIELLIPFLCYIVAELFNFSGVLAVIAAGAGQSLGLHRTRLFEAELTSSTKTTWEIVSFTLNSLVFLLLGLQLPGIVSHVWNSEEYTHGFVLTVTLIVSVILFVVRLLGVIIMARGVLGKTILKKLQNALILTLSGVKGAVSLAAAFSLPIYLANGEIFTERPLILFITSGAIIFSLVLALITLPIISDNRKDKDTTRLLQAEVLEEAVRQLLHDEPGKKTNIVASNYSRRIRDLRQGLYSKQESRELRELHRLAYTAETASLKSLYRTKKIKPQTYYDYLDLAAVMYNMTIRGAIARFCANVERFRWAVKRKFKKKINTTREQWILEHRKQLRKLFSDNAELVELALTKDQGYYSKELVRRVIDERNDLNRQITYGIYGLRHSGFHKEHDDAMMRGYYVERRVIHQFLEAGKITLEQANLFRIDVNKLESFTLEHDRSEIVSKFLELTELSTDKALATQKESVGAEGK